MSTEDQHNVSPVCLRDMVETTHAYHVTNIPASEPKPTFHLLEYNLANNIYYDDFLVGMPAVFLTTTLRDGTYPLYSTYPTVSVHSQHWRALVPLDNFIDYKIYRRINTVGGQIQLILVEEDDEQYVQNIKNIVPLNKSDNPYLCYFEDKWYTNEYDKTHFFVNIIILHDVKLELCTDDDCNRDCRGECEHWNTVGRSSHNQAIKMTREETRKISLKLWSSYQDKL